MTRDTIPGDLGAHLEALGPKLKQLTVVRNGQGSFQASFLNERGSYTVDVRPSALDAMLVASGAIPVLEMNRRYREEAQFDADIEDLL